MDDLFEGLFESMKTNESQIPVIPQESFDQLVNDVFALLQVELKPLLKSIHLCPDYYVILENVSQGIKLIIRDLLDIGYVEVEMKTRAGSKIFRIPKQYFTKTKEEK